ncbi:platelet glycoprotein Ib beta chain-like [Cynoglossus semilaevis]|uniref:platelet glycoprotein Ib beta chain-like n=1 Tax=Cynoglossus semilaevis TaxID=244447 RepID=UPI000D627AC0|nr:platelet glycoprotein Ib beta chain-like [Cynoglossus semilaevis]
MARLLPLCLLLPGQTSSACPRPCSCQGTRVDCSSTSLTSSNLPTSFPSGTTELLLHNNPLTTLPNRILDDLTALRSVSLHRNPWVCLRRHPSSLNSHLGVNCSSPPHLKGRLITYLTEEEVLDSCHYWYCNLALFSQVCLIVFLMVQAALLVALVVFLKKFEKLSKEEESFTAEEAQKENEYSSL